MLRQYYYTDKEKKELLNSIVILVDTREKVNDHIVDYFEKKGIKYKTKALTNGDYSFYIPANPDLNIDRDIYFDKNIVVERKASLDELAGNLTTNRTRFEEEMATCDAKKYLLIENSSYSDLIRGNYKSKYAAKSYAATIHSFNHRYNLEIMFMPNHNESAFWIYNTFIYWLREVLR